MEITKYKKKEKYISNLATVREERRINKYFLKSLIDLKSGFGDIYIVIDKTEQELIMKVQKKKINKKNHLMNEYKIYQYLIDSIYTTNYCKYFQSGDMKCLVMDKYDIDLKELYNLDMNNFHISYKKKILLQIFELFEYIHRRDVVHKDIKFANFTWNFKEEKLYIIDFGSSNIRKNRCTSEASQKITGTLRYASLNAHMSMILNHYDDIESLLYCYSEIELNRKKKKLSWRGLTSRYGRRNYKQNLQDKWDTVYHRKKRYLKRDYYYDFLPTYLNILIRYFIKYKEQMEKFKKKNDENLLKIDYTFFINIIKNN
jgi:serine/threonine protein kinase